MDGAASAPSSSGLLAQVKARLLQEASAVAEAVAQFESKDAGSNSGFDEHAHERETRMVQTLSEVARCLIGFEQRLQGGPVTGASMCQEADVRLARYQADAQSMADDALQACQEAGRSALAAQGSDIASTHAEVSQTRSALCAEVLLLQEAMRAKLDSMRRHASSQQAEHDANVQRLELRCEECERAACSVTEEARATMQEVSSSFERLQAAEVHSFTELLGRQCFLKDDFHRVREEAVSNSLRILSCTAALQTQVEQEQRLRRALEEDHAASSRTLAATEMQRLHRELQQSQSQLMALTEEKHDAEEHAAAVGKRADELHSHLQNSEAALQACEEALAVLQAALHDRQTAADAQRLTNEKQLQMFQGKVQELRAACEASTMQLQAAQQQIAAGLEREAALHALHESAQHTALSKDAVIDTHADEVDRLTFLVLQAEAAVTGAGQELQSLMSSLMEAMQGGRVDMGLLEESVLGELQAARQTVRTHMRELLGSLLAIMQKAQQEHAQARVLWQSERHQLQDSLHAKREEAEALLSEKVSCEMLAEHLRKQLADLAEEMEGRRRAASRAHEDAARMRTVHEEEVASMRAEMMDVDSSWQTELAHEREQAQQRLSHELSDLEQQWQRRLQDSTAELLTQKEQDVRELQVELACQHETAMGAQQLSHADELRRLQTAHEREYTELQEHALNISDCLADEHRAACRKLEQQAAASLAAALAEADATHAAALQRVGQLHAAMMTKQQAEHEEDMRIAQSVADRQLQESTQAAQEMTTHWEQRYQTLQHELLAAQAANTAALRSMHESAMSDLQADCAKRVAALEDQLASAQLALGNQHKAAAKERAEHLEARTALKAGLAADKAAALADLAEQHRAETEEQARVTSNQQQAAAAEHAASLEEARRAAAEQQLRQEAHIEDLEEHVTALQIRYENRVPRREDLDRMKELKASLAEKSAQVSELQSHAGELEARMQQLHGELLLRDNNHNRALANGRAGMRALDVGPALGAQQGLMDWMLKPSGGPQKKGSDSSQRSQRGTPKR